MSAMEFKRQEKLYRLSNSSPIFKDEVTEIEREINRLIQGNI